MRQITFLGTGHGMPIASSTSCILVEDKNTNILFDTSGGHDIIGKFTQANKPVQSVQNIFISHYDSDHILGIVPIIRFIRHYPLEQKRRIFCSEYVKKAIESLFQFVANNHYKVAEQKLEFVIIQDQMKYELNGWVLTFFDVKSNKSPQFGCAIHFPDATKLSFLGDEPLRDHYLDVVKDSDIFIHEAFCLDKDQETFKPHPKNHSTVKECAENAAKANAKKLVLFHMEDKTLATRKTTYKQEAEMVFSREVFVPVDLDTLDF